MNLVLAVAALVVLAVALFLGVAYLRTNRLIRRSKNHLEGVFDHVDPMVVVDPRLRVLRANRPFARLCRRPFADLLGRQVADLAPFLPASVPLLESCLESNQPRSAAEVPSSDGSVLEMHAFPLPGPEGAQAVLRVRDVSDLAEARRELVERNEALGRLTGALQSELEMAREIQQALLPKDLPRVEGLRFRVRYQPCRPIGGDLYDASLLDERTLVLFVADVSGHGLPAAFEAALVRMSLLTHLSPGTGPVEVFERMNLDLRRSLVQGHYVTAFLGFLDLETLEFRYCRASHPRPLLLRADGTREELGSRGLFLGIVEDGRYREDRIRLQPGDRLCLFTDGYYESADRKGRRLGYKGFVERIPASTDSDPEPVLQEIEREFPGMVDEERDDDRTFIALDVVGGTACRPAVLRRLPGAELPKVHAFRTSQEAWDLVERMRVELSNLGWSERDSRRAQLLASELCVNAVVHGLHDRLQAKAYCAWVMAPEGLHFSVHDEGPGFDFAALPDPRHPDHLGKDHGRGVFLVRRMASDLWYDDGGSTATFRLARTAGEP